jgi:glycosyltransferase involved in cell wall biosynthesis
MEKNLPDIFYAVGEGAWNVGMDLAEAIERPVLLDVWNGRLARRVPRGRHARMVGGYVTPTRALREVLCQSIDPGLVSAVPTGVALPVESREVFARPDACVSIAVVGGGRDVPAYRAMLGGLSRVNREYPQLQIFLELRGRHQHEIWRYAQKLRLLDRISTVRDASPHRRLLTQCDMMLLPERYGELFSIMLEAMANGMVVIASHDPMIEMLQAEDSARIASADSPEEWAQLIRRTIQDPEGSRQLGQRARALIAARHTTNIQASTLIDVFEQVVSGGAYSFTEAARSAAGV